MEHTALPADTDPAAYEMLIARWRTMTLPERFAVVEQLCADVELMARAGIASTDPELSEHEILRELARRRFGHELADAAYADLPRSR